MITYQSLEASKMLFELRDRKGFYYLACPYTAPTRQLVQENIKNSLDVYSLLVVQKLVIYHPTYTTHYAAMAHWLPTDHVFWIEFNDAFISPSQGLIIANIPGWMQSRGVSHEIATARKLDKPIYLAGIENEKLEIERYSH